MRVYLLALTICVCAFASFSARTKLDPLHQQEMLMDMAYLPNGRMLGWISGGMDDVLSDVLWLRSMRYVMSHFGTNRDYTYLYRVYDIITDFDPQFVRAYRFGGYFLTGVTDEYDNAVTLLEKGWENNPDSWQIAYELGSVYNLNLKDTAKAAEWFSKAAQNPKCPSMIREHATVIYEDEGRLAQALAMWSGIYNNSEGGGLKEVAEWNVKRVRSQMMIAKLEEAIEIFRQERGHLPASLADLHAGGIIRFVPKDGFNEDLIYVLADDSDGPGYSIGSREIVRREIDKRITYISRFVLARFKREHGRWPASLGEMLELGTVKRLPEVPYGVFLDYDPETGKLSYDKDLQLGASLKK